MSFIMINGREGNDASFNFNVLFDVHSKKGNKEVEKNQTELKRKRMGGIDWVLKGKLFKLITNGIL